MSNIKRIQDELDNKISFNYKYFILFPFSSMWTILFSKQDDKVCKINRILDTSLLVLRDFNSFIGFEILTSYIL